MSSETEAPPAGTTVYYCPLCGWTHAELPPAERELLEAMAEPTVTVLRRKLAGIEAEVEAHLNTHGLLDWLTEVNRLRSELDMTRAELARTAAEKRNGERHALLVSAILVRRLGGNVQVTDAELVAENGTLVRIPEVHGFTLTVTG